VKDSILKIAVYGKGGIGKSTVSSNVSAALAQMGENVLQIGASPKVDSTAFLNEGKILQPDILASTKISASKDNLMACIKEGFAGVMIAESGGPEPATGCAGRGVAAALDLTVKHKVLEELGITVVIYDVLGDVVCGGFAKPMESGFAESIYIVTSGELMALYAANNLCIAVKELLERKPGSNLRVAGLINNMRGVEREEEIVEVYAKRLGVKVLAHIPRSEIVQEAEGEGGTVIEKRPNSEQAAIYRHLAENIRNNKDLVIPNPMDLEEVLELIKGYSQPLDRKEVKLGPTVEVLEPKQDWAHLGRKDKPLKMIAIYGKGGIGKSTVSSNTSAALARMGETVLQMGCDPKRDSISTLCGKLMPTILDTMRANDGAMTEELMASLVHKGYCGVLGVESGGPRPGVGCAGAGVMESLRMMEKYNILEKYHITFAIFDVLGDVVCGGFAQPMRAGYAREVYIVSCGEVLTLIQINNIARSIKKIHDRGVDCACAGIINNMRGVKNEEKIVEAVAEKMGLPVIMHVPRSQTVQDAEFYARTVIDVYPDSEQATIYQTLAKKILHNKDVFVPNPLSLEEVRSVISQFG